MSCAKTLYRAVISDHCVMLTMAYLQRVHQTNEKAMMSLFGFDPRMCENVYKEALLLFSDAVVRFGLEVGVENIVVRTRYAPILENMAVVRKSEDGRDQPDCPGWYVYDFRTADMREVPPAHRGGRNCPESKPRAR